MAMLGTIMDRRVVWKILVWTEDFAIVLRAQESSDQPTTERERDLGPSARSRAGGVLLRFPLSVLKKRDLGYYLSARYCRAALLCSH